MILSRAAQQEVDPVRHCSFGGRRVDYNSTYMDRSKSLNSAPLHQHR